MMSEAPERIWTCRHVGEYGHYFPEAVEAEGEYGGNAVEYVRADRIEELGIKLAKAVQGFREIRQHCANSGRNIPSIDERIIERCEDTATSAIAELTGGKDE